MTVLYVDTSAAIKLIHSEPESDALADHVDAPGTELVSSVLLETEMRRAVQRHGLLTQDLVTALLRGVALREIPNAAFVEAGLLPGASLRSLDALHLIAAIGCGADAVLTYDARMTASAVELGLTVVAPGRV